MAKLNDTQLVLLSTAAQRETSSLYPLPSSMLDGEAASDRAAKAIAQLLKRNLLEERETTDATTVTRTDNDVRYGIFITASGIAAIGVDQSDQVAPADGQAPPPPASVAAPRERGTKAAAVIALLERSEGATLAELIEATSWLPHTTRAALTGLRKKGHSIERSKRDDLTCYRIVSVA